MLAESLAAFDARDLRRWLRAEQMRRSLVRFMARVSPQLPPPVHLRPVLELWQRTATEQVFAVIELPPRHAKTTTAAHALAWHVFRSPEKTSAYATYAQTLARSKSRTIRNLALDAGCELASDMANLDEWRTTKGGGLLVTGVGGPLTGQGISGVLVVDDAVKNREDANSPTIRDGIWDWFRDVVWTRLEDDASVLVMATRWHEDDLIGRLLGQGIEGVPFERIRLPAEAEPDDPLGRSEGAPLWPERFPSEKLAEIKLLVGSYSWAALYQQRPAPLEGGMFKRSWWSRFDEPPERLDQIALSVDATFGSETGSRVSILVVGRKGPQRFVLDNDTRHMGFTDTVAAIRAMRKKWPKATRVLIEKKANGAAAIETLARDMTGVIAIEPKGGKESRAAAIQPAVEAGNVFLPRHAPWVDDFIVELATFPNGSHDDQVDSLSQVLIDMEGSNDAARALMLARW